MPQPLFAARSRAYESTPPNHASKLRRAACVCAVLVAGCAGDGSEPGPEAVFHDASPGAVLTGAFDASSGDAGFSRLDAGVRFDAGLVVDASGLDAASEPAHDAGARAESDAADAQPGSPGMPTPGSDAGVADAKDAGDKVDAKAPSGDPTFHVFLLLGQSNMAGFPKAQAADKVKDERVRVLGYDDCQATGRRKDVWDTASPPLHECWNGAIGPGDYFAKTLVDKIPEGDTLGLVPCAISGEKIETFMKNGGAKYTWIVQRAKQALKENGVIEGILFHQGESNCGAPDWPGKVKTLVSDLRKDLGLKEDVPFLAGELVYSGNCSRHNTLVNQLPSMIPSAHVVSASGLALDPSDTQWHLHFGHDAQVTFGKRYAEKMIEALGW